MCRDFKSLNGISWMQLRSHLDALEMKKLYGLNPMAPEFVPKVLRAGGQPMIMASSSSTSSSSSSAHNFHASTNANLSNSNATTTANLPPLYPVPPAAVFPTYPPPPPFHPQWLIPCGAQQRAQLGAITGPATAAAAVTQSAQNPRNVRQRIVPMAGRAAVALATSKVQVSNFAASGVAHAAAAAAAAGHMIPPPGVGVGVGVPNTAAFGNFNATMNSSFAQLNAQFQVSLSFFLFFF